MNDWPRLGGEHIGPEQIIRVTHLSTSRSGGAAIAARRIVAAQCAVGIDAELVYRGVQYEGEEEPRIPSRGLPVGHAHKAASRLLTISNALVTSPPSILFTPFSTSISKRRIRQNLAAKEVIHLHNIYNFVSIRRLLEAAPKAQIVATLHDERLITSGCHYSLGCTLFSAKCHPCPQTRLPLGIGMARQTLLHQLSAERRFSIVAPSRWMASQVALAGFPTERITHIPNPVDPALFPLKVASSRSSRQPRLVGWLPGKLEAPFWDAIREINLRLREKNSSLSFEVLTPCTSSPADIPVRVVSAPKTESERAEFWSEADIGVSLTAADNFPNVVLESLAVGTPFIVNDIGGAGEAIRATGGGVVIQTPYVKSLADQLMRVMNNQSAWDSAGRSAAESVRTLYSPAGIGALYMTHYRRFLDLSIIE